MSVTSVTSNMAPQRRDAFAPVPRILQDFNILQELNESEGDFSTSDDDTLYEPPASRIQTDLFGHSSSSSESERCNEEPEDDSTVSRSSPAISSSSSLLRGQGRSRQFQVHDPESV